MSHIVVIGASAGIGLATLRAGLEAGHQMRAFSRAADRIGIDDARLEKMPGNALNANDVAAAVATVDVVIQTLGVPFNLQLFTGPITLFSQATEILLPAMMSAGVSRLIAVTGFGAGESRARINPLQLLGFELVFGRAYRDKSLQEQMIQSSGLDWTIVRPGVLTNGPKTGRYQVLVEPRSWRNGIVSRADVADFLIRQAGSEAMPHQAPVVIG